MTAAGVIAPVVPPLGAGRTAGHGPVSLAREPLPLADLPPQRTSAVVYGASAVDDRGRVVDRVVLRALGWPAGHRLDIRESAGRLTVVPDPAGRHQVTGQGHLRIPAVHRGRITKQGSRLVRWAAIEAVQRLPGPTRIGQVRDRVAARRGRNIGVVAAARELTELIFYGLRDHHVRALAVHIPARTPVPA